MLIKTNSKGKESLKRGSAIRHHPSTHLADESCPAAKTGDRYAGDQPFVFGKPANTDGNRHDICHAGTDTAENADTKDCKKEIVIAQTGNKPAPAKQQATEDSTCSRAEFRQKCSCRHHGQGKHEIKDGKGDLYRPLFETNQGL